MYFFYVPFGGSGRRGIKEKSGVAFEWIWAFSVKESRLGMVGELQKVISMDWEKRTNQVNLDTREIS